MKTALLLCILAAVISVESYHTFIGTNIMRAVAYHQIAQFNALFLRKRVENFHFSLPAMANNFGRSIQGILAYDMNHSTATANITQGGLGYTFVDLHLKSERGKPLRYDIFIYA